MGYCFLTSLTSTDFPVSLDDKFIGEYWFLKEEYKNPQAIVKADLEKLLDGKSTGNSIVRSKIETISERARLLYVGITRAKEYLFLTSFETNRGKKNETLASKYILEFRKYIEASKHN